MCMSQSNQPDQQVPISPALENSEISTDPKCLFLTPEASKSSGSSLNLSTSAENLIGECGNSLEERLTLDPMPFVPQPLVNNPFYQAPQNADAEWRKRKQRGETSEVIDELMNYQGMQAVKETFLAVKSHVDICKKQGRDPKLDRYNIVFQGNPGTGKTTVARLYAKLLHEIGILDCDYVKETSGVILAARDTLYLKRKLKRMLFNGGVLFIDEAYQLVSPHADIQGKRALDLILKTMEDNIGRLVVIFTGHKEEMEAFFEHQPGLPSRIPNIDSQYHGQMKVEGGFDGLAMRIAIQRLAESSNSRSFGNTRTVDNLSTQISRRQSQRLCQMATSNPQNDPDYLLFTQDDIIGPEPLKAGNNSAAMTHLQSLVGIDNVKKYVQSMVRLMQANYQRELRGIKPRRLPLNQLFVGQPGTGKTTVARLYGSILADLGILSRGDVVLKTPADFIGDCVGKSERLTQNILDASVGKVLVIDEAYMLDPGDPGREQDRFKTGVLDTIVANIQGSPNEDRCIIMVGYEDRITDMFHHANPGLRRRFNMNNMCRFENYNISQLDQILSLKMREQDLTCTPEARKVAHDILQRASTRPSFANASEVESCLAQAKANFEARLNSQELEDVLFDDTLQAHDFDKDLDRTKLDCRDLLEGEVQESVIQKFISYQTRFHAAKQRGLDVGFLVPTRFIFKGPPGTGKRTTAQAMGRFFYNIELLPTDEVLQYSTVDFVGEYVGSTPPKTRKLLAKALGKVVFIDNVDRLGAGHYETEAVNEIVHFLNQRAHDGKIVVILAGGNAEINSLFSKHSNLAGPFPEEMEFNGLSAKTCISLLDRKLRSKGIDIEPTLQSAGIDCHDLKLEMLFEKMQYLSDWRNSHDGNYLANEILGKSLESMGSGNAL
ncbi:hypothetical protein LT330_009857 [Penicillium expansum]|nr:hypothetical protein LT330_009857 [Penicillium expansum]